MIGKIVTGKSFSGVFQYLLAQEKQALILGGNAAGRNQQELTLEFSACAQQRPTTLKPVKHLILSFSPEDGHVSQEKKNEIAHDAVENLGYIDNQYVVIGHGRNDPGHDWEHDHDHIHVVVNMITIGGKRINDWRDKMRLEQNLRQLEERYQLTPVLSSQMKEHQGLTHGQTRKVRQELKLFEQGKRTRPIEVPNKIRLQGAIDAASTDNPDFATFVHRLRSLGINSQLHQDPQTSRIRGISYSLGKFVMRGCKLHNASWSKLFSHRALQPISENTVEEISASVSDPEHQAERENLSWNQIDFVSYFPKSIQQQIMGITKKFELKEQLKTNLVAKKQIQMRFRL